MITEEPLDLGEEKEKWERERTQLLEEIEKRENLYVKKLALRDEENDFTKNQLDRFQRTSESKL